MPKQFSNQKSRDDSGFGSSASGRFLNRDGSANVQKKGVSVLNRFSWYHTMLNLSPLRFITYLVIGYIAINLVFALIYYAIGVNHLTGIDHKNPLNEFIDVFFFSSQTFTTVGYGRIAPVGFTASLVATFEAFLGLLCFAIATGLFYGRFSRPRAFLKFSDNALVAPYQGVTAIMFRLAPYKNNSLTDAFARVSAAIETDAERNLSRFYNLKLELDKVSALSLNWTIVHKIDEDSPFFGFTEEDFKTTDIELIVHISAFDEVFSNNVVQRTSYITPEIVYGAKFRKMYYDSADRQSTILNMDMINDFERVELTDFT